jgi:hypothetical protein
MSAALDSHEFNIRAMSNRNSIAFEFMKILVQRNGGSYPASQARTAFALADQFIASSKPDQESQ